MAQSASDSLITRLTDALPAGSQFTVHHVSAPPANCPALFSAPPNEEPEPTECESHFLSISTEHEGENVHVFAVEVLIYTTATLTTIFVSKADSTGYLHLAGLPKGTTSPIRTVTAALLEHLIEIKRRKDARLVLSLFARAQNQYLFPGSIENTGKHVLDDRGLIKWWCRIFDSVLKKYPSSIKANSSPSKSSPLARGYLVVPGCEAHETRAFFPRGYDKDRWFPTDPLRLLGKSLTLPERCLIPRFPDDPKARFAIDLDDELPENGPQPMNSPEKNPHPGKWRSVRSIEQFWELMAFRQECAAGRLVGFLWGVFESEELRERPDETKLEEADNEEVSTTNGVAKDNLIPTSRISQLDVLETPSLLPTPKDSLAETVTTPTVASKNLSPPNAPLSPTLRFQQPAPDSPTPLPASTKPAEPTDAPSIPTGPQRQPTATPAEVGSLQVSPPTYTRIIDSLMELDYEELQFAKASTKKFVAKVLEEANAGESPAVKEFGLKVTGSKAAEVETVVNGSNGVSSDGVAVLDMGLVRKKKRPAPDGEGNGEEKEKGANGVNTLSAVLVRKKPKV